MAIFLYNGTYLEGCGGRSCGDGVRGGGELSYG